jgi:hypothetical protein
MKTIKEELRVNAKVLRARAKETERLWREASGIGARLGVKRQKRATDTKAKRYARWRDKQLGRMGAASEVRRIEINKEENGQ